MKKILILLCFGIACSPSPNSKVGASKIQKKITEKVKIKSVQKLKFPLTKETAVPYLRAFAKTNKTTQLRIKTKFGNIDVRLFKDTPLHRANFVFLTEQGYFDGVYFHRVSPDFVIQGGNSDEMKTVKKRHQIGSYRIPAEFYSKTSSQKGKSGSCSQNR